MRFLKTSVFCAAMAAGSMAWAQADPMEGWESPDTAQPGDTSAKTEEPTASTSSNRFDVNGVVTEVDKKNNSITVVTPLPSASITALGNEAYVVDQGSRLVAIQGQWKEGEIMRDGKSAKLSDLKEGDVVRTSFDSSSDTFGDVSAMSKHELKKELKRSIDQLKKDVKDAPVIP